jgi:ABC-type phosphate transport system substrate-binding protein
MVSHVARRFPPAYASLVVVAFALLVPGAARAGTLGEQCSGAAIEGSVAGTSSPQLVAQFVWAPAFNTSLGAKACSGTQGSKATPKVHYEAAGAGMEAWGTNGHSFEAKRIAFVGTDEPPDAQQRTEIQSHSAHPAVNTLETIPVLQEAVAIVVNLPTGCHATSTPSPGRLVLDNVTLQKIFRGVITKWSEIADGADKLSGEKCNPASAITRVVRQNPEAATSILKRYLSVIHPEHNILAGMGWRELAAAPHNAEWPGTVARAGGDLGEANTVAATPGSIGYADLALARAQESFAPPSGGAGTAHFWVALQDNGLGQKGETYGDPSTTGDSKEVANANCAETAYTNGESSSPPAGTLELWSEVSTATTEPHYSLCGLTYDLAFHEYSQYPGTTLGEATTANNYLVFLVAAGGGQELIKKHDYSPLPAALRSEAATGAERSKF